MDKIKALFSKIKEAFSKLMESKKMSKIKKFLEKNYRFILAGILFILFFVLLFFADGCHSSEEETDSYENFVLDEEFLADEDPALTVLLTAYYEAYASGDVENIQNLAKPITENELSYIEAISPYIEGFEDIVIYRKHGVTEGSYLVTVCYEMRFVDIEETAPGMEFFYVECGEDGNLYINNLYSTYNLKKSETEVDVNMYTIVMDFQRQEDVITIYEDISSRYSEAVNSSVDLYTMMNSTLPEAINEWKLSIEEETEETTDDETDKIIKVRVTSTDVNVRASANANGNFVGKANQGTTYKKLGVEGDWTKIDFNGTEAYIKSEFVEEVEE